jgi:hypothetical protein
MSNLIVNLSLSKTYVCMETWVAKVLKKVVWKRLSLEPMFQREYCNVNYLSQPRSIKVEIIFHQFSRTAKKFCQIVKKG